MTRTKMTALLFAAGLTLLSACGGGGDGSSKEAKPYVDAMSKSMAEGEDSPMSEKQATCWSEKFIDTVGIDRVKKAGKPEDFANDKLDFSQLKLTEKQAEEVYDHFDGCGVDMRKELVATMGKGATDEQKTCIDDSVTDENLKAFFVAAMRQGEEKAQSSKAGSALMGDLMKCLMPASE